MTRISLVPAVLAATLTFSGCNSTPQQTPPAKTVATPVPVPGITGTDAQKQADEKLWREVEEKKRKSKSANLNKTKAYQNYIP